MVVCGCVVVACVFVCLCVCVCGFCLCVLCIWVFVGVGVERAMGVAIKTCCLFEIGKKTTQFHSQGGGGHTIPYLHG